MKLTKEQWRQRQLTAAAYHEAGHAVARCVLLGRSTAVTINPDGSGLSHGTGASFDLYREPDVVWAHLVMTDAGFAAEYKKTRVLTGGGREDWAWIDDILSRDPYLPEAVVTSACRWARRYGDGLDKSIRYAVEQAARRFVRAHWATIVRVADALVEHHALTAEQVQDALEDREPRLLRGTT